MPFVDGHIVKSWHILFFEFQRVLGAGAARKNSGNRSPSFSNGLERARNDHLRHALLGLALAQLVEQPRILDRDHRRR